jgi:prepilin-type N-terminal cleavage/methylation domain-containing protein
MRKRSGFTLVELLVVIGIIALLISILLPALGAARRQAQAVKCASAMREMGQCINFYSIDNKGYAPPAQIYVNGTYPYYIGSDKFTGNLLLPNFLTKYATKGKYGVTSTTAQQAGDARKSIFWGCPAWEGYITGTLGDYNRIQRGIAMNPLPAYEATYPANGVNLGWGTGGSPAYSGSVIYPDTAVPPTPMGNWSNFKGKWNKLKAWTHPAERCLLADSLFWVSDSYAVPMTGQLPAATDLSGADAYPTSSSTTIDCYRHGKYPPKGTGNVMQLNGGKVAYNILYADMHVVTCTNREEAWRSVRMRFPG